MRDWWQGSNGRIVSMAIHSEGWYGVPDGLIFSFPCRVSDDGYVTVVEGLSIDDFAQAKIDKNVADLQGEKAAVADLL
jgi:malate dehydrogenase